jgi:4'-phosphopantetheinyl transferase
VSDALAIDVTLLSLRVSAALVDGACAILDERERTEASTRAGDVRRRYVAAHAATRLLIADATGRDPAGVRIEKEPAGRPVADGIAFSLAHSGDRAAVAIAVGRPATRLGVDLERVRDRRHLDRLAPRVFEPEEYAVWRALAPRARPRAFARRWTELEALLKARGTGIAGGLASAIAVPTGWSRVMFAAGTGYVGAVAADASPIAVTTRRFRLADALTRRAGTAR